LDKQSYFVLEGDEKVKSKNLHKGIGIAVTLMLGVFSGSSYGLLNDTFDPPNAAVDWTRYGSFPWPGVVSFGPSGNFLRLTHDGANYQSNSYAYDRTDPGLPARINAGFDFRISSPDGDLAADGLAIMFIPTAVYGNRGPGANAGGFTTFEKPNFAGVFGVGIGLWDWPTPTNLLSAHWDGTQISSVDINPADVDLDAGVFHGVDLSLAFVPGGANLSVSLVQDVYGTPGAPVTAFSDLFIAGLSPYEYRVQFGGRSGALNANIDLDNINVTFIPAPGALLLGSIGVGLVDWLRRRRIL